MNEHCFEVKLKQKYRQINVKRVSHAAIDVNNLYEIGQRIFFSCSFK